MKNVLENKALLVAIGSTAAAVSSACWGYLYAYHELEEKFDTELETLLNQEVDKVKRFYEIRNKYSGPEEFSELAEGENPEAESQEISIPKELLNTPEGRAAIMEAIKKEVDPEPEEEEESPVLVNAFDIGYTVPEFDWEEMISERSAEKPYIISQEEFLLNEAHYEQYNLTFFEGDGVLLSDPDATGKEEAIPDTEQVVGDANLQMFGVMSGNNNVVYIQNDLTEVLFCVNRSFGTATEALFGVKEEDETMLQHSSMKRRRHRSGDDE